MNKTLSCSIVLYNNSEQEISRVIECSKSSFPAAAIYLIDNSATNKLGILAKQFECFYIHEKSNVGFGAAHNIAIKKSLDAGFKYHLILNPDIYFFDMVLPDLIDFLDQNPQVGFVMPKILYPNGDLQYLCKLLPTPIDLIFRRFFPGFYKKAGLLSRYELHDSRYDHTMMVPSLSGCFMLLRSDVLRRVGGFDEKFFMYLEDIDLCRRIAKIADTVYYPDVAVFHEFAKGSYKSIKLLKYHIKSALYYFNKWGWFFDSERKLVNKKALARIRALSEFNK